MNWKICLNPKPGLWNLLLEFQALEFTLQIPIRSVSLGHIFSYSAIYLKLNVACHHEASIKKRKIFPREFFIGKDVDETFWSNVSSKCEFQM